jgi:hypothetical protein
VIAIAIYPQPAPFLFRHRHGAIGEALVGWRRSVDRTCLHTIFLLTGNFTGKFALSGLRRPIPEQETSVLEPFLDEFPTQIIRENISAIREF